MYLIEELVRSQRLVHPHDRSALRVVEGRVLAASGQDHGPVSGPLNFLESPPSADLERISPRDVERMRAALELPPSEEVRREIAQAIAATGVTLQEAHLSAEARMLAERFRIEEFASTTSAEPPSAPLQDGRRGQLSLVSHSIGAMLTVERTVYRNVRVRNDGPGWLAKSDVQVETAWNRDIADVRDEATVLNELPIDLAPGREITLMLRIRTPAKPGRARLRVALRTAGRPGKPFLEHDLELVLFDLPVFAFEYHASMLDYEADHRVASDELVSFLRERYSDRRATLLEIGSGVHPAGTAAVREGHRLVATDVSPAQCILGSLYFRHAMPSSGDSLAFMGCDGLRLPFADASFDGVLFFASFHHIAEPLALLAEARRVIRPDGFVYIACDCCTPEPRDPEYLMEVRRGINEQVWTLPEYAGFFRQSGFEVAQARIDFNSMKVFVGRREPRTIQAIERKMPTNPESVQARIESPEFAQAWAPVIRLAIAAGAMPPREALEEAVKARSAGADAAAAARLLGLQPDAALKAEDPAFMAASAPAVRVALAYIAVLGRSPDPEGLAYWSGKDAPLALIAALLGSAEYRGRPAA